MVYRWSYVQLAQRFPGASLVTRGQILPGDKVGRPLCLIFNTLLAEPA
jgi:hypothetical protein